MKPEVISFDTPLATTQPNPTTNVQIEQENPSYSEIRTRSVPDNLSQDFSRVSFSTPLHRVVATQKALPNPTIQTSQVAATSSVSRPINRRVETLKPVWATTITQPKTQNTQFNPQQELPPLLNQLPIEEESPPLPSMGVAVEPLNVVAQRKKLTRIVEKIYIPKPQFSFPKIKLLKLHNRIVLGGAGVLLIGLMVSGSFVFFHSSPKTIRIIEKGSTLPVSSSNSNASESQLSDSPSATLSSTNSDSSTKTSKVAPFTPVVPEGESQLANLGGNAYDSAHQIYTFNDLYLAQPLQVSEQVLPTGYGSVAATVSYVAHSIKKEVVDAIPTTNGNAAYVATDANNQVQTVVYSYQGLLILVKSSYPHTLAAWAQYLESLQ